MSDYQEEKHVNLCGVGGACEWMVRCQGSRPLGPRQTMTTRRRRFSEGWFYGRSGEFRATRIRSGGFGLTGGLKDLDVARHEGGEQRRRLSVEGYWEVVTSTGLSLPLLCHTSSSRVKSLVARCRRRQCSLGGESSASEGTSWAERRWWSTNQSSPALSSCEAEYYAVVNALGMQTAAKNSALRSRACLWRWRQTPVVQNPLR